MSFVDSPRYFGEYWMKFDLEKIIESHLKTALRLQKDG